MCYIVLLQHIDCDGSSSKEFRVVSQILMKPGVFVVPVDAHHLFTEFFWPHIFKTTNI